MTYETTTEPNAAQFADRLQRLRERIALACGASGRSPSAVLVVAVSKTHPPQLGRLAVAHGVADLGESRVQELLAKLDQVPGARWHLVGRLQRNKARDVVGRKILVHSLDRRPLADTLSRRAVQAGVIQRALVQVNVGDDPHKGGCDVDEAMDLVAYARNLPNLAVEGLMTVPPLSDAGGHPGVGRGGGGDDPGVGRGGGWVDPGVGRGGGRDEVYEAARPHFAQLRALRDRIRGRFPEVTHLSMGMTADLEAAVAEGATIVRVGTALFGARGDRPWRGREENAS